MPQGGVKWITDGLGVQDEQEFSLALTMTGLADVSYILFALDADIGTYNTYYPDCIPLPSTLLLLGSGLACLVCLRRKFPR